MMNIIAAGARGEGWLNWSNKVRDNDNDLHRTLLTRSLL